MPTSLKNLMVTGVFGEKVRLREGTVMHVHHVHTCNYCLVLVFYTTCMQSTHLMSRFPIIYAHNIGKPVYTNGKAGREIASNPGSFLRSLGSRLGG